MVATGLLNAQIILTDPEHNAASQIPILRNGAYGYCSADSTFKISIFSSDCFEKYIDVRFNREIELKKTKYYKGIVISWPSKLIKGQFEIVVTPKQIYIKDGMVNDQSTVFGLYWVNNISYENYRKIYKKVTKDTINFDRREKLYKSYHLEYSYKNFVTEPEIYLDSLNSTSSYVEDIKETFDKNVSSILNVTGIDLINMNNVPTSDILFEKGKPLMITNYFNKR